PIPSPFPYTTLFRSRVKGTGLNQRLCHALGTRNQRNLIQVVTEGLESTLFSARLDDRFHYFRAHVADRAHAEADIFANSLEVLSGLVNIWRQDLNAKVAAVSQVDSGLVFLIRHRGQKRGH